MKRRNLTGWRIYRAGSLTAGYYCRGWFAMHESTGTGAWLASWHEALDLVIDRTAGCLEVTA